MPRKSADGVSIRKKKETKEPERRYNEIEPLLKKYPKARYYFILGGRGTGKTYPVIKKCIKDAIDGKGVFAYLRRYKDSLKEAAMKDLVSAHDDWIEDYTNGEWNRVGYYRSRWYLELWDVDPESNVATRIRRSDKPIGGAWALNTWETDKGPDFGKDKGGISHIIMDEALSKGADYLSDEWGKFQNVIASLVRDRWEKDTKIWMLANPVTKWRNPYFTNMGIATKMLDEPGTTEITYPNEHGTKAMSAVFQYIAAKTDKDGNIIDVDPNRTNVFNTFFAFPNSKGKNMSITHGIWEMDDAAHLPDKYLNDSSINRTIYFKSTEDDFFACDIMKYHGTNQYFLYFRSCDEIEPDHYYFTLLPEMEKYAIIAGVKTHPLYKVFAELWATNRLYYESNEIADAFHGWQKEARKYEP